MIAQQDPHGGKGDCRSDVSDRLGEGGCTALGASIASGTSFELHDGCGLLVGKQLGSPPLLKLGLQIAHDSPKDYPRVP
jgi:hypothetical protein